MNTVNHYQRIPSNLAYYSSKLGISTFSQLIIDLMNELPASVDMSAIEAAISRIMANNNLMFVDYKTFLSNIGETESELKYYKKFETTNEYFFDFINSEELCLQKVINLCYKTISNF